MGGKHSRNKGRRFEQKVARILNESGWSAKRRSQAWGGKGVADVEVTEWPMNEYYIECKSYKRIGIFRWIDKMLSDCGARDPVLVLTEDGRNEEWVVIRLPHFIDLCLWSSVYNRKDKC